MVEHKLKFLQHLLNICNPFLTILWPLCTIVLTIVILTKVNSNAARTEKQIAIWEKSQAFEVILSEHYMHASSIPAKI